MDEQMNRETELEVLPFHEYCANCDQRFDETILDPTVTVVETDGEQALHSFCDEECFSEWTDRQ